METEKIVFVMDILKEVQFTDLCDNSTTKFKIILYFNETYLKMDIMIRNFILITVN